jgi:hypothetical protein
MPITVSGHITRANLPSPLANLAIEVDPYWLLPGGGTDDATINMSAGLEPSISALKYVWADSPFVAGQQLVLATPDNAQLTLRMVCDGTSLADAQTKAAAIITAIRQQMTFTVSLTFDAATYAWNCYTGDYQVAFNQLHIFGYCLPLYVTLPRDPTPVSGPV